MSSVTRRLISGSFFRISLVTSAVVAACMLGVVAAGPQQAGRDDRSSIGSVDFVVVTRDGQPITDLKADEITLRVGNRNRAVLSLQFVSAADAMTGAVGAAPVGSPAASVPPAFFTNIATRSDAPRSIVLVIDDESMPIGQETKLRASLSNFVRDLPATDMVALVTVPHGGIKVNLTADRARLLKAISEISPIAPMQPASCRTGTTLSTLESTLGMLNRTTDQPVIVAFVSANLVGASTMEQAQVVRADVGGGGLSAQAGVCHLRNDDFVRVGTALAVARAQLYVIHPDYSQAAAQDGIGNLQGQTGAPLFHLASNTEPGLYRMARETSGYYIATFQTDPEERGGKTQPASIRTTRRDAELRGRPYAVIGNTATTAPAATAPIAMTAFEMVRSGRMFRDLPLRATATSFRRADGSLNVVGLFEPADPSVTIVSASAALIDETGKGIDYWNSEADSLKTWPAAVGLSVSPGKYRLRIAAIDSKGRTGLVDDQVVAVLGKVGALNLSGLVLGVSQGTGFSPRLQFSNEATAVAYAELYGVPDDAAVGAVFEVARSTNGEAFLTLRGEFAATSEDGKFFVTAKIPLAALAPGDYVVRAMVGAAGQPSMRVVRTLRKVG